MVLWWRCTQHASCQKFLPDSRPSARCPGRTHGAMRADAPTSRFLPKLHAGTSHTVTDDRRVLVWRFAMPMRCSPLFLFGVPLSRGLWQKRRGPSSLTTGKQRPSISASRKGHPQKLPRYITFSVRRRKISAFALHASKTPHQTICSKDMEIIFALMKSYEM